MKIAEGVQNSLQAAIGSLHEALREHGPIAIEKAEAEFAYRQARAKTFTQIMGNVEGKKPTDEFIKAQVDLLCADEMHRVRLAEARLATSDAELTTLRAEVSAYQSVLNTIKAEAEIVNYASQYTT